MATNRLWEYERQTFHQRLSTDERKRLNLALDAITEDFVNKAKKEGVDIYLSPHTFSIDERYGFFTDGTSVVSFNLSVYKGVNLYGNLSPTIETGSGWVLRERLHPDYVDFRRALNATPPPELTSPRKWAKETLEGYLARYQRTSNFERY